MRGRRPELKPIEGGRSPALAPPENLPAGMHAQWRIIIDDLQERKLLCDSMRGVIEAYVTAVWTVSECCKALAADGFFVKTKTGEPKPHPAAGMLSKHTEVVARLGAELGLTPAARSRKGLQSPQAPDEDDAAALGV